VKLKDLISCISFSFASESVSGLISGSNARPEFCGREVERFYGTHFSGFAFEPGRGLILGPAAGLK
jgi:hypothetical protein